MQLEIDAINQEHQRQKEIRSEQEKLAEQKVVEYMKKKAVSYCTSIAAFFHLLVLNYSFSYAFFYDIELVPFPI